MKLISGFLTLLALIAFSTLSSADQLQSDLNICSNERERLEEKVVDLEKENESLKKNTDQDLQTCQREPNQTLHNFQKCQRELEARTTEINRSESERRIITIALESCQKTLDEASSTTQAPIFRKTTTETPLPFCPTCGLLLPFDSDNSPLNANTSGFASGTWIDGSTVYPGVGDFTGCSNNRLARISANFIGKGPGAYTPCGINTEMFTSTNVKYFCNHPKLAWVVANQSTFNSVPGKQIQVTGNTQLAFIRFQVTKGSTVYQQIGYNNLNGNNGIVYWDGGKLKLNDYPGNYEVLTCTP